MTASLFAPEQLPIARPPITLPGYWPFKGLEPGSYRLIMADPAWSFENWSVKGEKKNAKAKYRCMPLDDIKRLPVRLLAAPDCVLWLWATNPMLDQAFEVIRAWGFTYKTGGSWEKMTKNGKQSFGPGYILRTSNEPYLIATVGKPKTSKRVRTSFRGYVRGHSRKPLEGYRHAEELMLHQGPMLELFSRETQPGWDVWGDEVGKFDAA